jgi:hypothetical protein
MGYKQKLKWLGAAAVLVFLLCYELAVKGTLNEYSKFSGYSKLNASARQQDHVTLSGLDQRQEELKVLYEAFVLDTLQPEKNLLSVASNFCKEHHLDLKEYRMVSLATRDSTKVLTRAVSAEGSFIGCLYLVYELERRKKTGKVSSVEFKSYVDPAAKSTRLTCTIYIQNLLNR